jgi:hypothetical protein
LLPNTLSRTKYSTCILLGNNNTQQRKAGSIEISQISPEGISLPYFNYMVRRSAPKEAQDRLWQGLPPHSGKVSKAASHL